LYKMFCGECENRFTITNDTIDKLILDADFLLKCPRCNSIEVNLLEVEGQKLGF
jgi:phage FluMu protein Com